MQCNVQCSGCGPLLCRRLGRSIIKHFVSQYVFYSAGNCGIYLYDAWSQPAAEQCISAHGTKYKYKYKNNTKNTKQNVTLIFMMRGASLLQPAAEQCQGTLHKYKYKNTNTKNTNTKYTNTQIQHMTKCHKHWTYGIFLKRGLFKDIKNYNPMCQTHKYKNTNTQIDKNSILQSARKTLHVVYFWKEDCSEVSKMIFTCVKRTNTKIQIHK